MRCQFPIELQGLEKVPQMPTLHLKNWRLQPHDLSLWSLVLFCLSCELEWRALRVRNKVHSSKLLHSVLNPLHSNNVEYMSDCQKYVRGILLILAFPLLIIAFVLILAGGLVVGVVMGFFCGPIVIIRECDLNPFCGCLFYPVLMVAGIFLGFFGSLVFIFQFICRTIASYCSSIGFLLCNIG